MREEARKKLYWLIGAIVIIACGLVYYFQYYTKTPEYTCKIIGEAYQSHNVQEFHRHVDVDNILDKYIDEAFYSDPEIKKNPLSLAVLPLAKQVGKNALKEAVDKAVRGENKEKSEEASNSADDLKAAAEKVSFGSTSSKKIDDNNAEIYMNIKHKEEEHQLTMKASRLEDGTWKIYEIPGLYKVAKEINAE